MRAETRYERRTRTAAEVFNQALEIGNLGWREAYLARVTPKTQSAVSGFIIPTKFTQVR
jgi:hypothetical protein